VNGARDTASDPELPAQGTERSRAPVDAELTRRYGNSSSPRSTSSAQSVGTVDLIGGGPGSGGQVKALEAERLNSLGRTSVAPRME
jgi:hypothetical protein